MTTPVTPEPPNPGNIRIFAMNITPDFAAALAEFQSDIPKIDRDRHVEIPTKDPNADDIDYWYTTLPKLNQEVLPKLAACGLSFTSFPGAGGDGKGLSLRYLLMHKSGGYVGAEWPFSGEAVGKMKGLQALGSAITYIRRYALQAATGVAAEEDDDGAQAVRGDDETPATARRSRSQSARTGQAATNTARRQQAAASEQPAEQPAEQPPPEPEGEMSPPSRPDAPLREYPQMQKKLIVQFAKMDVRDRDKRLLALSQLLGRDITTQNELTAGEAFELIGVIEPVLDLADSPEAARRTVQAIAQERAAQRAAEPTSEEGPPS
jgi:hypothetical protein